MFQKNKPFFQEAKIFRGYIFLHNHEQKKAEAKTSILSISEQQMSKLLSRHSRDIGGGIKRGKRAERMACYGILQLCHGARTEKVAADDYALYLATGKRHTDAYHTKGVFFSALRRVFRQVTLV